VQYDLIQVSDLHLGAHNCLHRQIRKLIHKIRKGKIKAKVLVIAGDGVNHHNLKKLKHKDWKIIKQLRKLEKKMEVIYILGNHDCNKNTIEKEFGIKCVDDLVIKSGDINVFITHGHFYDKYITSHPIVVSIADTLYNFIQFVESSHSVARFLKKKSKKFIKATVKVGLGVSLEAKNRGCKKAMHGHNHNAGMRIFEDIEVYDSGSFCEKPCTYLTLLNGHIEIHKLK